MTGWRQLDSVLDAAAGRGDMLRFWWRDDDAGRSSSALLRLLEMAERKSLPLALAVVPAWLETEVQGQIAGSAEATVLQHGYAHVNHAGKGAKSIELGGRPAEHVAGELRQGFAILEDAFGAAFFPALVPPWNRIDPALHEHLRPGGYLGLSVYGRRAEAEILPGVGLVNTHVDPVDWRGTRGYVGDEVMLERLIGQLDLNEPIGILSHHLAMDEACWAFLDRLLSLLKRHPAARVCSAPYLFAPSGLSDGYAA
ncbi:MAG: polysaccharide deacetylase family protein [Alphaproteobacteria bacterium]